MNDVDGQPLPVVVSGAEALSPGSEVLGLGPGEASLVLRNRRTLLEGLNVRDDMA